MSAAARVLQIEFRRSSALWPAVGLAAVVAWGTASAMRPDGSPALWFRSSVQLGLMLVVAACIMCGIGAWAAGRDRRRQMDDLLATMPRPAPLRDLTLLVATLAWGLVASLAAGSYIFVISYRAAAWGEPMVAPVVVGLLTVVAGTSVGYLGGALIPSRLAAPLVPVGFSACVLLIGTRTSAVAYLSPLAMDPRGSSPYDVFYRPPMLPFGPMCLWLAGVTACALALLVLRRRRSLPAAGALIGALVIAASGMVALLQAYVHPPWERIYPGQPVVAYEPACVEHAIPICFHPAYATFRDGYGERIGHLVEPLAGVPGGPMRAEQLPSDAGLSTDGTLAIVPGAFPVTKAAFDLVHAPGTEPGPAQIAIALWLLDRAGEPPTGIQWLVGAGQPDAGVTAAAARFAALDPEAQRDWLNSNFQELRAGSLELDDLP